MKKLKKHLNKMLEANITNLIALNKGNKNITYFCETNKGKYVIKFLTPQFLLKRVDVEYFQKIYNIIITLNNSNPKFIAPLTNTNIYSVNKWGDRYFSIFHFINSDDDHSINRTHIKEMAKIMNQFHNMASDLQCNLECMFDKYVSKLFKNRNYKCMLNPYYQDYKSINQQLNTCLIHGDFAINNVLFKGNDIVGLIDFDCLSNGSREEELIRACRNFENKLDKQTFVSTYLKSCPIKLNLTRDIVKKFIIKDFINEVCVYYFQTKIKNLESKDFKTLLNQSIKEFANIDKLIDEIWEIIKYENSIC